MNSLWIPNAQKRRDSWEKEKKFGNKPWSISSLFDIEKIYTRQNLLWTSEIRETKAGM